MNNKKQIGLAIVGCGTIGRIRALMARDYPGIGWIGLCDINSDLGNKLLDDCKADFFTKDYNELLKRTEVDAVIIATDENHHFGPTMAAIEANASLFIEKPLATDLIESRQVLDSINAAKIDAVLGYTQRFRRRFLAVKQKLNDNNIGDVTSVVTRAFMNSMVPIATVRRTNERKNLTPMVVSGTHSLDMSLWLLEGKNPKTIFAQSVAYRDGGSTLIYAGTSEDKVKELSELTFDELKRAADSFSQSELDRARAQMKAGLLMGLESASSRAERLARMISIWDRIPSLEETVQKIDAISLTDMRSYAEKIAVSSKSAIALYGPVGLAPDLSELEKRRVA